MSSGEVTFQSPSQAGLRYDAVPFSSYDQHERLLWEDLPLHSVRRLAVNMVSPPSDQELERLMELLRDPKSLEDSEFWGECGHALSRLGHYVAREGIFLRIQTLNVCRGGDERRQALRLKCLMLVEVTLICAFPAVQAQCGKRYAPSVGSISTPLSMIFARLRW